MMSSPLKLTPTFNQKLKIKPPISQLFQQKHTKKQKKKITKPFGYWREKTNQRLFLEHLAEKLNYKTFQDWYNLSFSKLQYQGGNSFVTKYYHKSYVEAVTKIYVEYDWEIWRFKITPRYFWRSRGNRRLYLESLSKEFGIRYHSDWYQTPIERIDPGVSRSFGGSFILALSNAFPEFQFLEWNFMNVPIGFWKDEMNRRFYFDSNGDRLGVSCFEDWYGVKGKRFSEFGVSGLLGHYYRGSMVTALLDVYPEYVWDRLRFERIGEGFLEETVRRLGNGLGITGFEDWYRVSTKQIEKAGFSYSVPSMTHLHSILSKVYPDKSWDLSRLKSNDRVIVIEDYKHGSLRLASGSIVQLDIYAPQLSLALEYHGSQHYGSSPVFSCPESKEIDREKFELCRKLGITLIGISYSLETTEESVKRELGQCRPDVLLD